jgi:recombination protein RecA
VTETKIVAPEMSGQTTVYLRIVTEAQSIGGTAASIDTQHAPDPTYAARCGVSLDGVQIA